MICSHTDRLYLSPSLHALSAICRWVTHVFTCTGTSVCERVCQRFHTATDCYLVIHTVSGNEWVKRIVTRVWMCVCMWVCVLSCVTHGMPNSTLDPLVPCVSRQAFFESYFLLWALSSSSIVSLLSSTLLPLSLSSYKKLRIYCPHCKSCCLL